MIALNIFFLVQLFKKKKKKKSRISQENRKNRFLRRGGRNSTIMQNISKETKNVNFKESLVELYDKFLENFYILNLRKILGYMKLLRKFLEIEKNFS